MSVDVVSRNPCTNASGRTAIVLRCFIDPFNKFLSIAGRQALQAEKPQSSDRGQEAGKQTTSFFSFRRLENQDEGGSRGHLGSNQEPTAGAWEVCGRDSGGGSILHLCLLSVACQPRGGWCLPCPPPQAPRRSMLAWPTAPAKPQITCPVCQ